jgi:ribosomal protein S8
MNRHFYNFIASFNSAAKTGKWTFVVPLRNKFTYEFVEYLFKEKIIEDYRFIDRTPDLSHNSGVKLGSKKNKKYCYPLEIRLKSEFVSSIDSLSTPGKYFFKTAHKLTAYANAGSGAGGLVICLSARFKGFCRANELAACREGGLVLCVVRFFR